MPKKRILISSSQTAIGLVEVFEEFEGFYQKVFIINKKNKSNFLSITKNIKKNNIFAKESHLDVGEKYITYFKFLNDEIIFERRFNRILKSTYIKERVVSNRNGEIFLIDYNGEKIINFNIKNIKENGRIKKSKKRI